MAVLACPRGWPVAVKAEQLKYFGQAFGEPSLAWEVPNLRTMNFNDLAVTAPMGLPKIYSDLALRQ